MRIDLQRKQIHDSIPKLETTLIIIIIILFFIANRMHESLLRKQKLLLLIFRCGSRRFTISTENNE